jgi:hypothetical protein
LANGKRTQKTVEKVGNPTAGKEAKMASARLIRFFEHKARGLSDAQSARLAGYGESVAMSTKRSLWSQPDAAKLYREAQRRHGRHVLLDSPTKRAPKPMKTYFLKDASGRIKIGRTCNVVTRLKALRVASAEKLELILVLDGDREQEMQLRFVEYRISGGWYRDDGKLTEFLADEVQQGKHERKDPAQEGEVGHDR